MVIAYQLKKEGIKLQASEGQAKCWLASYNCMHVVYGMTNI